MGPEGRGALSADYRQNAHYDVRGILEEESRTKSRQSQTVAPFQVVSSSSRAFVCWCGFSCQACCNARKRSYCTRCLDLNAACNAGVMRNKICEGCSQAGVSCNSPRLYHDKRAKGGEDSKLKMVELKKALIMSIVLPSRTYRESRKQCTSPLRNIGLLIRMQNGKAT